MYVRHLAETLQSTDNPSATVEELRSHFKTSVLTSDESILGHTVRARKDWISSTTLSITGARQCSLVLTAIHHSNGRFCDFLLFFSKTPGGQTPQPIVMQNGLNDADSGKDVPFGVKIESFFTTWPLAPQNCQNLATFSLDLSLYHTAHTVSTVR